MVKVTCAPVVHVAGLTVIFVSVKAGFSAVAAFLAAIRAAVGSLPIAITRTPSRAALDNEI
jgi:hypothetical protein